MNRRTYIPSFGFLIVPAVVGVVVTTKASAQRSSVNTATDTVPSVQSMIVQVTPAIILVDPKTHTATIHFTNATNSIARVTLSMRYAAPRYPSQAVATGLIAADSGRVDSLRRDSITTDSLGMHWSLASWIKDLPDSLTLAPHATKTLTLHLAIPSSRSAGEYSTHLLVGTTLMSQGGLSMTGVQLNMGTGQSQSSNTPVEMGGSVSVNLGPPAAYRIVYRTNEDSHVALP